MDEHVTSLLGACLDGELDEKVSEQIQKHLEVCNICHKELTDLKDLSDLLKSSTISAPSSAKFASSLYRVLPARPVENATDEIRHFIWWLVPVLVLIITVIIQIASGMTAAYMVADQSGLLGDLSAFITSPDHNSGQAGSWSFLLPQVMQGNLAAFFALLYSTRQAVDFLFTSIIGQVGLALVYITWLLLVWTKRTHLLAVPAGLLKNHNGSIGV